jgi:hypothetical protein
MTSENNDLASSPAGSSTERMRLHRERRRSGVRCFTIQLLGKEIDVLIGRGLLRAGDRHDRAAIVDALHAFLDEALGDA